MAPTSVLHAAESSYTATTTLFSDLTHSEYESDSDTRAGAGIRGDIGADLTSGAHSLVGRYGATLETERSSRGRGDDDNFSLRGSSRYHYFQPGSRFDFNAGHSVRSVRNDTGFRLDDSSYDTQNSASAGAGINFYPGDVTTFRVAGQGSRTWQEGDTPDSESVSVNANLSRQVSEQTSVFLTGSRTWEEEEGADEIILDSASVGLRSMLHNGSFSASVGVSSAENDNFENEAVIGSLARTWDTSLTNTRLKYDRTQSSNLLDLAFAPIPELGIEDEFSVRYQGVTVRDQLSLSHRTRRICDLCTVNLIGQLAKDEEVANGDETWEYLAGAGVRLAVTDVKSLSLDYRWQGDALEERSTIDDERHSFAVTYRHQLTELATWGASFDTAMTRGLSDEERYRARLFVTLGWDSMNQEW
ncbi:hypothetical protein GCM10007071_29240 [Marinobacter zhanjiangensis]|uniref:Beta-barrel porin 2 n=2 Tax=Marinobacter zhanjiangensis TaxID=578215 RepID=A0ABQ3B9E5_9GAMM|nr:hypothetical protein GCM10007071_29240 [Marinobacter zhanjiangensis]